MNTGRRHGNQAPAQDANTCDCPAYLTFSLNLTRMSRYALRRFLLVGLLLAVTGTLPSLLAAQAPNEFEVAGDSLFSVFDNDGALRNYEEAAKAGEVGFDLLYKMARAAHESGQDADADGRRDRAEALYEKAVGYAEQLQDRFADRAASHFMAAATIGKLAQFKGGREKVRIGRAVEGHFEEAMRIDSTFALSYVVGGIFNREVAQLNWIQKLAARTLFGGLPNASLDQSKAYLRKAIELDRHLIIAHWELAQTCLAMDRVAEAVAHLKFLVRLPDQSSEDRRLRERAAVQLQELEES